MNKHKKKGHENKGLIAGDTEQSPVLSPDEVASLELRVSNVRNLVSDYCQTASTAPARLSPIK